MWRRLKNARLKHKLTAIIMMISLVVVCIGAGSFILAEVLSYRQTLISRLGSTAGVVGANTYPALLLRKRYDAERILASLDNSPDIAAAYLFTPNRETFASYLNVGLIGKNDLSMSALDHSLLEEALDRRNVAYTFNRQHAQLCAPISDGRQLAGGICLQSDLTPLYRLLGQFILGTILVCSILGIVAYLLSTRLQEAITAPVSRLAHTIGRVARHQTFRMRAEKTSDDEIGDLVDGFNSMLDQLATRDAQLEEHRHNLEQQVAKRTRQLKTANDELKETIEALKQMRLAAEQANQAKSLFLAKMSHEIRTPMIGIMGMAEQLADSELPSSQHQMAVDVQQSGETLLGILDDVLDFSRIEAGRLELEQIPFSLQNVCEEVATLFTSEARKKGLELNCAVAPSCRGPFLGDPVRIRQILNNLVGNAVKFTRQGEILLAAEPLSPEGVRLIVVDTGIGIPKEAQKSIFESFSQADNSMARKYGGSGLGLAIVAQLTALMHGNCRISSDVDKGSRFEIDLPFLPAENADALTWVTPAIRARSAIIVDSSPYMNAAIASILSDAGLEVVTPPPEALLDTLRTPPDLLLLDERLLASAPELSEWLHTKKGRSTRCLLLTAGYGLHDTLELVNGQRATLLRKPLRLAELFAAIEAKPSAKTPVRDMSPDRNGRGRVLLVEDNPTTQRLVRLILGQAGFDLDECDNGEKALTAAGNQAYDLILMDCEMPGMNGFDTTSALRRRGLALPVVALTAHVGNDIFDRCRQAGMDDILHKPFRQNDLLSLVGKWIPQHREGYLAH